MSLKAVARLALHRSCFRQQGLRRNCSNYDPIRCLHSFVGSPVPYSKANDVVRDFRDQGFEKRGTILHQKRGFLGCGDGEEGNALSKVYEERRVLGYTPEQLFNVVAAVDLYEDFLPWCRRSTIVRRNTDGSFDAELEIGFKFLVESYISHVELNWPKSIKTRSSQTTLFDHLINIWEFSPGPVPGSCQSYFFVDFKFQSPFYRQIANVFFKEAVSQLVASFDERCRLIYGPGVPLLQHEA